MSSSRRGLGFWLNAWLPVALGIGLIVLESSRIFGSDNTSHPLRWLYQAIFGPVSNVHWNLIHTVIRKTGHFLGYGVVGLTWLRAWWMTLRYSHFLQDALLALAGTALIACGDELHQSYLPNRSGSPWDVLLDCCGAITLQLAVYIFLRLRRPKKLARAA